MKKKNAGVVNSIIEYLLKYKEVEVYHPFIFNEVIIELHRRDIRYDTSYDYDFQLPIITLL